MPQYVRRPGDARPFESANRDRLAWHPSMPIRWLPRHGQPGCQLEWISQRLIILSAYLPIYVAIVVTLTLIAVLWRS